ncbi:hypothetical protein GF323_05605 [Candidatus Woesearchaeota archaeon]|nr:hypothetical protein [Candidatus Woesearchaeota archaeon]
MALDPGLGIKLVYVFGWTNIITVLLVLFSCRCTPIRLPAKIRESAFYRSFYKYHCYYWWIFIASVIAHGAVAVTVFGNPFT